jgi:hypothetical protein
VLLRINEQRNILHEIRKLKAKKLPSKASYRRKDKGRDGRDKKTGKKT